MRLSLATSLVALLAIEPVIASNWFSKAGVSLLLYSYSILDLSFTLPSPLKVRWWLTTLPERLAHNRRATHPVSTFAKFLVAVYNKWHETELERWLSDHEVPYPTPADRKDLENLMKANWQAAVESPYVNWDTNRLQKQLEVQGHKIKTGTEKNKDHLTKQVKGTWAETSNSASNAYGSVRDWIFDRQVLQVSWDTCQPSTNYFTSWTESQLKDFCDKHGIPVPQPRKRDTLLKTVRENYQSTANKLSETASYPGDWLYATWSNSELKSWMDEHGVPAPQTNKRDKLIATVRRNSRIASLNAQHVAAQVSASAEAAKETLTEKLLDSWSDSQIKEWCDKNGIKVPQGSTRNELVAIARKNSAKLASATDEAASTIGAATSSAGNQFAKASDDAKLKASDLGNQVYSQVMNYADQLQIALGLKTDAASSASNSAASASKSVSSAYQQASKSAKGEL